MEILTLIYVAKLHILLNLCSYNNNFAAYRITF